jgi:geranylgeranylglycerol-phosphate geranylgeranyltransferase
MLKTKLSSLARLFRFELPFTAGICVVLGQLLALGEFPAFREWTLGFLSVFFISAVALILNDVFDIETDRINTPHRPLPAGLVTVREAVGLAIFVTALGLAAAFILSISALVVALLAWVVGFLYNGRFKKAGLFGNLMVSTSVGMTFIFGGVSVGKPFELVVWLFAALAFLINLGEEIAADAMDLEGDRETGSRSLPVMIGREPALRVSATIFLTACLIAVLPFLLGWLGWAYAIPFLLMDAVVLYSTVKLLDSNLPNRRPYIRWIYLSAMVAILAVIVMRLVG